MSVPSRYLLVPFIICLIIAIFVPLTFIAITLPGLGWYSVILDASIYNICASLIYTPFFIVLACNQPDSAKSIGKYILTSLLIPIIVNLIIWICYGLSWAYCLIFFKARWTNDTWLPGCILVFLIACILVHHSRSRNIETSAVEFRSP